MERARRESAAGRGTEENTEQVSHPWDTLATITAFDQGNVYNELHHAIVTSINWRTISNMRSNILPEMLDYMTFTFESAEMIYLKIYILIFIKYENHIFYKEKRSENSESVLIFYEVIDSFKRKEEKISCKSLFGIIF